MGGSTSQGARGYGSSGFSRTKHMLEQAKTQQNLTEEYLFWVGKEVSGLLRCFRTNNGL